MQVAASSSADPPAAEAPDDEEAESEFVLCVRHRKSVVNSVLHSRQGCWSARALSCVEYELIHADSEGRPPKGAFDEICGVCWPAGLQASASSMASSPSSSSSSSSSTASAGARSLS